MFRFIRSVPRNAVRLLRARLLLRLTTGLTLAAHGAQKCVGWFGGPGLTPPVRLTGNLGTGTGMKPCRLCAKAAQKPQFTYVLKWLILLFSEIAVLAAHKELIFGRERSTVAR